MEATALITLTSGATNKIKEIMLEQGEEGSALRVLMLPVGGGAQYMLSLENETKEDDVTIEIDGVRIVVDSDSIPLLEGTSIDYVEDLMRAGFVITNPNMASGSGGCGCGGNCSCGGH